MTPHKENTPHEEKNRKSVMATEQQVENISADIQDIKENVVGLARNLTQKSSDKAQAAGTYMRDHMGSLKNAGADALVKAESRVKEKPGQSVAIAFAAGMLASFLLGRRSS